MTGVFGLLRRERDFRRVYLSSLVSLGGDWFAVVPLLILLPRLTGSGVWGGLVLAADTAVFAALSPYAGTIADRLDRRRLMVVADVVSAAVVLLLLAVRSAGTAWVALVAVAGVAAAKAFYEPASASALPNLVPAADLATANALAGATWGVMLAVGASLGGVAAALFGVRACFAIDAASFAVSALLTARTRRQFQQPRKPRPRVTARADIAEAVGYVRGEPPVLALLACKPGVGLANGALALFPLLASQVFTAGPVGTGLLFAARGLGALLGPLAMSRVATEQRRLYRVLGGSILLCGVAYLGVAVAPVFAVALLLVVVAHVGGGANWTLSSLGLQSLVPDAVRGRVFSVDFALVTLTIAVSQALGGALTAVVAPRLLVAGFGAATVVYATGWLLATRAVRRRAGAGWPPMATAAGAGPAGAGPAGPGPAGPGPAGSAVGLAEHR